MQKSFFLFLAITIGFQITTKIRLDNPSFEGQAQDATVPQGWHPCAEGSTPDILPGFWGVETEPEDGDTYMGLITREDGSFENVGQRLSQPLLPIECYEFSVALAHSKTYSGYNMPLKLVIWGCQTRCDKAQLLAESPLIDHEEWEEYKFTLYPKKKYNYIILEAQGASGVFFGYKGNLLIDNCSTLDQCDRAMLTAASNF